MQESSQIQEQEVAKIQNENKDIISRAEAIAVLNQEDFENASAHIKTINTTLKQIEEKRLSFTKPLNESLKNINETFKKLKHPLTLAKDIINDKMVKWHAKERERIAAEQEKARKEEERREKIREAHKEKGHKVSDEPIVVEQEADLDNAIAGSHIRKRWTFRIVNPEKVPQSYYSIDEQKIRQAIAEGAREIPGIKIYKEEKVVTR